MQVAVYIYKSVRAAVLHKNISVNTAFKNGYGTHKAIKKHLFMRNFALFVEIFLTNLDFFF